jgi:hypothetical protein
LLASEDALGRIEQDYRSYQSVAFGTRQPGSDELPASAPGADPGVFHIAFGPNQEDERIYIEAKVIRAEHKHSGFATRLESWTYPIAKTYMTRPAPPTATAKAWTVFIYCRDRAENCIRATDKSFSEGLMPLQFRTRQEADAFALAAKKSGLKQVN